MSFSVKRFADEPILYASMPADFDYITEGEAIIRQIIRELDRADEQLFYIADLTEAQWGLDDIMNASAASARGPNAFLHHPNIQQSLFLVQDVLWELVAKGFNTDTYGNLPIEVFSSLDEALDYIRAR